MSTPETPRPGGAHRATPPSPEPSSGAPPLSLPLLSAPAGFGAIGLAAWMLLTSGDEGDETGTPPTVTTQPTGHSPKPEPSDTGGGGGDGDKHNGGDKNNNGGGKNDHEGGGQKNNGGGGGTG